MSTSFLNTPTPSKVLQAVILGSPCIAATSLFSSPAPSSFRHRKKSEANTETLERLAAHQKKVIYKEKNMLRVYEARLGIVNTAILAFEREAAARVEHGEAQMAQPLAEIKRIESLAQPHGERVQQEAAVKRAAIDQEEAANLAEIDQEAKTMQAPFQNEVSKVKSDHNLWLRPSLVSHEQALDERKSLEKKVEESEARIRVAEDTFCKIETCIVNNTGSPAKETFEHITTIDEMQDLIGLWEKGEVEKLGDMKEAEEADDGDDKKTNIGVLRRLRHGKFQLSTAYHVHLAELLKDLARAKKIMLANGIPEAEADAFIEKPHISLRQTSDPAVNGRIIVLLGLTGYDDIN